MDWRVSPRTHAYRGRGLYSCRAHLETPEEMPEAGVNVGKLLSSRHENKQNNAEQNLILNPYLWSHQLFIRVYLCMIKF